MKLSDKGIIIRDTTEEDLPLIYSIGLTEPAFQGLPFSFNAGNLADVFASEDSICLTAARKRKVLGFIAGIIKGDQSAVTWMMVNEKFRGSGIGEFLLLKYIGSSEYKGAGNILIEISESNTEAVHFFNRFGFSGDSTVVKLKKEF